MDEEGDGVCGCCCCRPPLGSSVGGGCEEDSCWEGEDGVSQAGGGGDRLLLCGLVKVGMAVEERRRWAAVGKKVSNRGAGGQGRMMSGGLGEPKSWGAAPLLEIGLALGLGFFFCIFLMFQNCPP